jgi:hypothetical protein
MHTLCTALRGPYRLYRSSEGKMYVSALKYADFAFHSSPAVFADPSLPHQIVLRSEGQFIIVSCNCLRYGTSHPGTYQFRPLARKTKLEPAEPMALWRKHMSAVIVRQ